MSFLLLEVANKEKKTEKETPRKTISLAEVVTEQLNLQPNKTKPK